MRWSGDAPEIDVLTLPLGSMRGEQPRLYCELDFANAAVYHEVHLFAFVE
jgi:hypothetical protein